MHFMFSIQAPWKCGRRAVTHQCSFARGKPVSSPRPRFYACITHSVRFDRADQHMAFGAENYSEAEGEGGALTEEDEELKKLSIISSQACSTVFM